MNIYLVNPSEKGLLENAGDRMPLGLMGISSRLKESGHDVKIFDLNHTSKKVFYEAFSRDQPDAVGVSVYTTPLFNRGVDIARRLKGKTRLIAGGHHASALPKTLLPYFDAVVMGEGEHAMNEALQFDRVIKQDAPSLAGLPQPDRTALLTSEYGIDQKGKRAATLITSRGCPNSCVFCGNIERRVRYEPVSKVTDQIDWLKGEGFEALYFLDDVFTIKKGRMREILEHASMPFRATTRANMITEDKAAIMADYCEVLSFGVESGDPGILQRIGKRETREDMINAQQICAEYKIPTKGFFILGLPGETERSANNTIEFSKLLQDEGMDSADFYHLTPYPGTAIWLSPERFGMNIRTKDFKRFMQAGPEAHCIVDTEELKAERIDELVEEAKQRWKD